MQTVNMATVCDGCRETLPRLENADVEDVLSALQETQPTRCHCLCLHAYKRPGVTIRGWNALQVAIHLNHDHCVQALLEMGKVFAVADPGFLRGDANPEGRGTIAYYLTILFQKLHKNEEFLAGGASLVSLPPMV